MPETLVMLCGLAFFKISDTGKIPWEDFCIPTQWHCIARGTWLCYWTAALEIKFTSPSQNSLTQPPLADIKAGAKCLQSRIYVHAGTYILKEMSLL